MKLRLNKCIRMLLTNSIRTKFPNEIFIFACTMNKKSVILMTTVFRKTFPALLEVVHRNKLHFRPRKVEKK